MSKGVLILICVTNHNRGTDLCNPFWKGGTMCPACWQIFPVQPWLYLRSVNMYLLTFMRVDQKTNDWGLLLLHISSLYVVLGLIIKGMNIWKKFYMKCKCSYFLFEARIKTMFTPVSIRQPWAVLYWLGVNILSTLVFCLRQAIKNNQTYNILYPLLHHSH